MLAKLAHIDSRVIFAAFFIVVSLPLIFPLNLPLNVLGWTRQSYDELQKLAAGDLVIMTMQYSPALMADSHPTAVVMMKHLMQKNVRVILMGDTPDGARWATLFAKEWEGKGKTYGVDIVDLGFLPGYETGLAAFVRDIPKTMPRDARGNDVGSLPIMKGIKTVTDVKLFIGHESGSGRNYVRQVSPYKIPVVIGCMTADAYELEPFLQAKQIQGLIVGLRGGAEYEKLLGAPGAGLAGNDSQNAGHLLVIAFVILGNIGYLAERRNKARQGGE